MSYPNPAAVENAVTAQVLGPLLGAAAVTIAALVTGIFTLVVKNRELMGKALETAVLSHKNDGDLTHQFIDDISDDRKELRSELKEYKGEIKTLREEVAGLREEVRKLAAEIKAEQTGRKRAEEESAVWRERHEAAEIAVLRVTAEAADWKNKYEGECGISALLSALFESAKSGLPPDTALLMTIESRLRQSGYLLPEKIADRATDKSKDRKP